MLLHVKLDTIYALSSGAGRAAIGLVRVSGPQTEDLLRLLVGSKLPPRRMCLRILHHPKTGEIIDQAMILWMPGSNNYTGEDSAEFHCHGSQAVLKALFEVFNLLSGVRPAEAGEFSRRAFANGKMDLVAAEGLGDLLRARTNYQRTSALGQLLGKSSAVFERWRLHVLRLLAQLEAAVDFAEEAQFAEAAMDYLHLHSAQLIAEMSSEIARSEHVQPLRDGIKIVLSGAVNVGKSSLLNALALRDAAIVSPLPGTTRDAIEILLEINGLPIILTDTAGLRLSTADPIEKIGMERTKQEILQADLVVWVQSPDQDSDSLLEPERADLILINKADLISDKVAYQKKNNVKNLFVSAQTGLGLSDLIEELGSQAHRLLAGAEQALIVRQRQKQSVKESLQYLNDSLNHGPDEIELAAEDVRLAGRSLQRLTGRIDVEDILGEIFQEFCIGK